MLMDTITKSTALNRNAFEKLIFCYFIHKQPSGKQTKARPIDTLSIGAFKFEDFKNSKIIKVRYKKFFCCKTYNILKEESIQQHLT